MDKLREIFVLPVNASAHGHEIDLLIYLVHGLMAVLFIGWGVFFIVCLFRFRKGANPNADYHGVRNHISTKLEAAVVIIEAILLIGFSLPFWAKQVNAEPNRKDTLEIRVVAEQFAWNIHYSGEDGAFGKTDTKFVDQQSNPIGLDPDDEAGKDDFVTINQLHLPIGRPAYIHLSTKDVMHSFSIPVMRVKQDAIPGMSIPVWFTPTMTGKWEIACAQLCGLGHYRMRGFLTVHSKEDFDKWYADEAAKAKSSSEEGVDDFWF